MQAMSLADVREIMDTCSLGQALEMLKTKAAEQPLRSLVERSPELQQARRTGHSATHWPASLLLSSSSLSSVPVIIVRCVVYRVFNHAADLHFRDHHQYRAFPVDQFVSSARKLAIDQVILVSKP